METQSAAQHAITQPMRRSERIRLRVPVTLTWHADLQRKQEQAFTVSISRFGCLVKSRIDLEVGTEIQVEYEERGILGKISYQLKDYATRLVELGIGFEDDGSDFWRMTFDD